MQVYGKVLESVQNTYKVCVSLSLILFDRRIITPLSMVSTILSATYLSIHISQRELSIQTRQERRLATPHRFERPELTLKRLDDDSEKLTLGYVAYWMGIPTSYQTWAGIYLPM